MVNLLKYIYMFVKPVKRVKAFKTNKTYTIVNPRRVHGCSLNDFWYSEEDKKDWGIGKPQK